MLGKFNRFTIAVSRAYIILLLLYWFAGELWDPFDLLIAFPWFVVIIPLVVIFLLQFIANKRIDWFTFAIIIIWISPFIFHGRSALQLRDKAASSLRVCSLNTQYFFTPQQDKNKALSFLKEQQCDVYLLQEIWHAKQMEQTLRPVLKEFFPHYEMIFRGEYITMSRIPIKNFEAGEHDGYLRTDIEYEGRKFSIYNVHIWNPLNARYNNTFERRFANPDIFYTPLQLRNIQLKELRNNLKEREDTIVISGDFNSMKHAKIIQELSRRYHTLVQDSIGLNATFQTDFPAIQIDHAFVSNELQNEVSFKRACNAGISDHCMLVFQVER